MERIESEEEKTEEEDTPKNSEVDTDDKYSTENYDGISLTNPSHDFSSPLTQNSIHTLSPDQVLNPFPFSPSLHIPHNFSLPIRAIPISTIPPSNPSPDPTPSRVTSHNLESLLAAIDIGTSTTPFQSTNTSTSFKNIINLNQTPQNDSPKLMPSIFQQPLPSDMPFQFGSLESAVAAFINKSVSTPKENAAKETSPEKSQKVNTEKDDVPSKAQERLPDPSNLMEKRMTKLEKSMKRAKGLLKDVLRGQAIIQQQMRAKETRDENYRLWVVQESSKFNVTVLGPDLGPLQVFPDVPSPSSSSSSDGSAPTLS